MADDEQDPTLETSPQGDGDRGEKGTPTEETEGQEEGEPSGE
jgi:hypothetical protein